MYGPPSMNKPVRSLAMVAKSTCSISTCHVRVVAPGIMAHLAGLMILYPPPRAVVLPKIHVQMLSSDERPIMEHDRA